MKLTTLLIIAAFVQVSAATFAQKVTYKADKVTLEQMIREIRKQTGYNVLASANKIDKIPARAVEFKNTPVQDVLDTFLSGQPLTFVMNGQTIIIKEKEQSNKDATALPQPAPITVTGKITDSLGTPLIGATVAVKGAKTTTITNDNGEFSITVQTNDVLVVSYIGYKPFELTITGNLPALNITLHAIATGLKEVVINTGFQTLPLERAAGSFTVVDNKLFNQRVSSNVIDRLEGNVPGLIFNKPNQTGNIADINIRGHSTLFSNDQPLIVLDNFPYDGDLNNLNPNDIQSLTVLKDAAAASIWGVRSGNGVIVLTTKKGKRNQQLKVEFNANVTISAKPNFHYGNSFVDANDFINIEERLFNLGYYDGNLSDNTAVVSPVVQLLANGRAGTMSATDVNAQINALRNNDVRNDLSKYFYQKSIGQQYNVNFSGGTANSNYYFSAGEDNNLSNLVGNSGNRITINSLYSFTPVKNLQINAQVNYVKSDQKNDSTLPITYFPYTQFADKNGNPLSVPYGFSEAYKASTLSKGFLDWEYRPLQDLRVADRTSTSIYNLIKVGAQYNFIDGLDIQANYQYERSSAANLINNSINSYSTVNYINTFTQIGSGGQLSYPVPLGGILNYSNADLSSQQARVQINYNNSWKNNQISLFVGSELHHSVNKSNYSTLYGYDSNTATSVSTMDFTDSFSINPYGSQQIQNSAGFNKTTNNFIRYFANGGYTYNGLYTLNLSASIDHSNLFGVNTNQKAVPIYSAGLAWDISKEKFYNIGWLPILKPRFTYGYTANINVNAAGVTTISSYPGGGQFLFPTTFAEINVPGNPDLRWEKTRMLNAGLDFGIKNNIISGSLEYYWKKGIDLFGSSPLSLVTGLSSFFGNTASTKGNGIDIVINTVNINKQKFKWASTLNLSHVIDKVTKYDVTSTALSYFQQSGSSVVPIVGAPVFGMYSYKWAGLSHDTGDPQGYVNGKPSTDYATILKNSSKVDSLQYNGPSRPTFFGSLRNTFSYGAISLSFNISYKFNYYFRRSSITGGLNGIGATLSPGAGDILNAWKQPGDEQHTNVPSLQAPPVDGNRTLFYQLSSVLVDKGDNIRMQDVSLSYDLIRSNQHKLPFSNLQIYGYINNVGILWRANKDHLDPDAFYSLYVAPRTYAIGLRASF